MDSGPRGSGTQELRAGPQGLRSYSFRVLYSRNPGYLDFKLPIARNSWICTTIYRGDFGPWNSGLRHWAHPGLDLKPCPPCFRSAILLNFWSSRFLQLWISELLELMNPGSRELIIQEDKKSRVQHIKKIISRNSEMYDARRSQYNNPGTKKFNDQEKQKSGKLGIQEKRK